MAIRRTYWVYATVALAIATAAVSSLPLTARAAFSGTNGKIAFLSLRDGVEQIYAMNPDGTSPTNITPPQSSSFASDPMYSPDGMQIVFAGTSSQPDIWMANADGTGAVNITNSASFEADPAWSGLGNQIAFVRDVGVSGIDMDIWTMNVDGTSQTDITNSAGYDQFPNWSPDGSKIVFQAGADVGFFDIHVMNADGSGRTALTSVAGDDTLPSWSPDGSKIAFTSNRDSDGDGITEDSEIYVMNADGSGQTQLTTNTATDYFPTFSPDGTQIAFVSDRDGNEEIYVMPVTGGTEMNLTNSPGNDRAPDWQPLAVAPTPTPTPSMPPSTFAPPPSPSPTMTPSPVVTPSISIGDVSVTEGNSGTTPAIFNVTLSQTSSQAVTVNYDWFSSSASSPGDFTATSGTLQFAPGDTSEPISTAVIGDTIFEGDEVFGMSIFSPTNATVADGSGIATILNDDPAPPPPANDLFGNAQVISGSSGSVAGTTVQATHENCEPVVRFGDSSVWFRWQAPVSDLFVFHTNGTSGSPNGARDTTLGVFTGSSVDTLTPVAADDDAGIGLDSLLVFQATQGTTYYVQVDNFSTSLSGQADTYDGVFTLFWDVAVDAIASSTFIQTVCGSASPDFNPDAPAEGQPDEVQQTAPPGGTVTTDGAGDGATPEDPVETAVTTPNGGTVAIEETNQITQEPPPGSEYTFFGQQVNITAPDGTQQNPLVIVFEVDASLIPDGQTIDDFDIFRNGELVPPCSDPSSDEANPDPCVKSKELLSDGDIRVTILTSQASAWNAGLKPPRQVGGGFIPPQPQTTTPAPASTAPASTSPPPSPVTSSPPATGPLATPPVTDTTAPTAEGSADFDAISPNGDGRRDAMTVTASFSEDVAWDFEVVPAGETRVAEAAVFTVDGTGDAALVTWHGTNGGGIVADGNYRWQLTGADAAGNEFTPITGVVTLDRRRPEIRGIELDPEAVRRGRSVDIRVEVSEAARVVVSIERRRTAMAKLPARRIGAAGEVTFTWDGRNDDGVYVRARHYVVEIRVIDRAGNRTVDRSHSILVFA